ncbi:MAG TPA: beta-galactosidase, partial [Gemmataceae bacterium]
FNEGWGQFKTDEILAWTKEYDPTRLVDGPSGWTDRGSGDMHDMHRYPGPAMPKPEPGRAVVLGEFGGLGLPLEGHLWWNKRNWGYRTYKTPEELRRNYETLIEELRPLISKGLAAAIYTQTTDVEGEVNGLMTYDREAIKFDPERMARLHRRLYEPPPVFESRPVVPTSEESGQRWRYTTERPPEGWAAPDFDDSGWKEGEGGFGTKGTPGTVVRTEWDTGDIWLRRTFELDRTDFANLKLRVHHDEDFEVYLNGERVASRAGYRTDYGEVALDPAAAKLLRRGANTLAVHCKQTGGGQYIDVGLVDVTERPRTASRE